MCEGGIVLDPFMELVQQAWLQQLDGTMSIELDPEYTELAYARIGGEINAS